jgi:transcriptional regulator with XRE-family HTH domain
MKSKSAGQVLAAAREAAGLTQYAVAKRAGLSPQALAAIETGRKPSFDAVRKVCAALGLTIQEVSDQLPPVELGEETRPTRGRPPRDE